MFLVASLQNCFMVSKSVQQTFYPKPGWTNRRLTEAKQTKKIKKEEK